MRNRWGSWKLEKKNLIDWFMLDTWSLTLSEFSVWLRNPELSQPSTLPLFRVKSLHHAILSSETSSTPSSPLLPQGCWLFHWWSNLKKTCMSSLYKMYQHLDLYWLLSFVNYLCLTYLYTRSHLLNCLKVGSYTCTHPTSATSWIFLLHYFHKYKHTEIYTSFLLPIS